MPFGVVPGSSGLTGCFRFLRGSVDVSDSHHLVNHSFASSASGFLSSAVRFRWALYVSDSFARQQDFSAFCHFFCLNASETGFLTVILARKGGYVQFSGPERRRIGEFPVLEVGRARVSGRSQRFGEEGGAELRGSNGGGEEGDLLSRVLLGGEIERGRVSGVIVTWHATLLGCVLNWDQKSMFSG